MTMIASYDWERDTFTHHDNPARTAWREAVSEVAEKAKAALPACNGRVEKAAAIVLAGDVELLPDGTAKVASQSNGQTVYHIANGTCDCADFPRVPHGQCKHKIARGIYLRATALAKQRLAQLDHASQDTSQSPAAQPQHEPQGEAAVLPLPEAPVSITLKATLHGHDVLVTLRGTDFASVKAQVEQASQWLSTQQPSTQPPTQSPTQPQGDESPYCHVHRVPLKQQHKDGRMWYSHWVADEKRWCKGK